MKTISTLKEVSQPKWSSLNILQKSNYFPKANIFIYTNRDRHELEHIYYEYDGNYWSDSSH